MALRLRPYLFRQLVSPLSRGWTFISNCVIAAAFAAKEAITRAMASN